jgi:hypothetical protein
LSCQTLWHTFQKFYKIEIIQNQPDVFSNNQRIKQKNKNLEKVSEQKKKPSSHWADPDQNRPSSPEPTQQPDAARC